MRNPEFNVSGKRPMVLHELTSAAYCQCCSMVVNCVKADTETIVRDLWSEVGQVTGLRVPFAAATYDAMIWRRSTHY